MTAQMFVIIYLGLAEQGHNFTLTQNKKEIELSVLSALPICTKNVSGDGSLQETKAFFGRGKGKRSSVMWFQHS